MEAPTNPAAAPVVVEVVVVGSNTPLVPATPLPARARGRPGPTWPAEDRGRGGGLPWLSLGTCRPLLLGGAVVEEPVEAVAMEVAVAAAEL